MDLNLELPDGDVPNHGVDLNMEQHEENDAYDNALNCVIDLNLEPPEENDANGNALDDGMNLNMEPAEQHGKKDVPNATRREIFQALLARSINGKLKRHVTKEVGDLFSVKIRTVQRIWKQGKSYLEQGIMVNVDNRRCNVGRKRVQVDLSALRDIPFSDRTTLEDVCARLHVSRTKLLALKREGLIRRKSNSIKPYLTDENKKSRLRWCVSMLDQDSIPNEPMFKGLFDVVFIDEKWFNLTRKTERYYMLPDEDEPTRTCKSKNFIPKIMLLCAVARPRFDSNGVCTFDGKIGCFPLVTYEGAKRTSRNRVAGTIEMKPIKSVTKEVTRSFIIDQVLPAIRARWPREDANKPIFIQQDNAKPHIAPIDPLFCEAANQDGFDIRLICQPPNSPDFNILDLGFFRAVQSIQYKKTAKTVAQLVPIVEEAFQEYSIQKSNRIFLTLPLVMMETMKIRGGNNFKIPHMKKGALERQGRLPLRISCDSSLVDKAMAQLAE